MYCVQSTAKSTGEVCTGRGGGRGRGYWLRMIFVYKCICFIWLFWKCLIKFNLFIHLVFWKSSLHGNQRTSFCLCLLPVSNVVHFCSYSRCHCWQICFTLCVCFLFCFQMFKCIKKGYYVLEFFIGVRNRDIMTKELSLICLFLCCFFLIFFLHGIIYPMLFPCFLLTLIKMALLAPRCRMA